MAQNTTTNDKPMNYEDKFAWEKFQRLLALHEAGDDSDYDFFILCDLARKFGIIL